MERRTPKKENINAHPNQFFWGADVLWILQTKRGCTNGFSIHRIAKPPLICTFSSKQNTVYEKSRKCLMYPKLYMYFLQYRKRSELRNSNLTTSLCPCLQVNTNAVHPSISVFGIQINGFDDFDDERSSLRSQWWLDIFWAIFNHCEQMNRWLKVARWRFIQITKSYRTWPGIAGFLW